MYKKITALAISLCMLISLFVPCVYAAEITYEGFTKTLASDYVSTSEYVEGQSGEAMYSVSNPGFGWGGKWSSSPNEYAVSSSKFKPTKRAKTLALRIDTTTDMTYRPLANAIDLNGTGGTYHFKFRMIDAYTSTDRKGIDFRFLLGSDNLYFGYKWQDDSATLTEPYIYANGTTTKAAAFTQSAGYSPSEKIENYLDYELSIALSDDGNDVITLNVYGVNADGSTGALKTSAAYTADLSGTIGYIGAGSPPSKCIIQLTNIDISFENPVAKERVKNIIDTQTATKDEMIAAVNDMIKYDAADKADIIAALKSVAGSLGYGNDILPQITSVTPDFTDGKAFAHEFADSFDITYNYPLEGTGTVYIENLDGDVIAESSAISGNKVTMSKTGEFAIGTSYVLTTDDAKDFKGDLIPEFNFSTVVVPTVNVTENGKYDQTVTISWVEEGFDFVSATLKKPSGSTVQISNNQTYSEPGEYELTITAEIGNNSDDTTIRFEVLPDHAPVAADVKITGIPETGEVLTGSYVYSDQNSGDSENGTQLIWYRGEEKIGEGETYTLTEADINSYITFAVIPVSNSTINPVGAEYKSEPFAGPFKPYATNVNITGEVSVGSSLEATYVYNDVNGDAEDIANTIVKWYEYADDGNVEITDNITDGKLNVTQDLIGRIIYATVTPASTKAPVYGDEAVSGEFEVVAAVDDSDDEEEIFVSDFPEFESVIAIDVVNNYTGLSGSKVAFDDYSYSKIEGIGFATNWSSAKNEYVKIPGTVNSAFFDKLSAGWARSYRGPAPHYRALAKTLDMSNAGIYSFVHKAYEYSGSGQIGGSDQRVFIGSDDWYFGYKSGGTEGAYTYVPQLLLPGEVTVLTGTGIAYDSSKAINVRLDIIVNDNAADEFKVKLWYADAAEPAEYSITATYELGNYKADYLGYTPTMASAGNGSRYLSTEANYNNLALAEEIKALSEKDSATEEELYQAFVNLAKYDGDDKADIIAKLEALAGGTVSATVVESTHSEETPVVAHETNEIEFKYDFMLSDGGEFVLKDEEGNVVETTTTVKENIVTLKVTGEVENGRTYTAEPSGITDYKGDALPAVTFTTYATPEINVSEGQMVSEQSTLTWDDTQASDITVTLTTPSGETKEIQNNYSLDETGAYTLVIEGTANGITNSRTITFTVDDDIPPVASKVRITGFHETGAVLTARYTFSDANGDTEGLSEIKWYKIVNGEKVQIGSGSTYTITPADENCNIVAGVTPKANSVVSPVGDEAFSGEFTGAYAPVADKVKIIGESKADSYIEVSYVYSDVNGDAEGNTEIKWYLEDGTEITENIENNKLKITNVLFEKNVYAAVTPKTVKAPFEGVTVTTEKLVMPAAPVVTDVVITGNAAVGGILVAEYRFTDKNFDAEGESKYEWKNTATGEVIGYGRTLTVKDTMQGMSITVTVTGVSERIPAESAPVTSAAVKIGSGTIGGVGGALGGAVGGLGLSGSSSGSGGGGGSAGTTTPSESVTPVTPVQPQGFGDIGGHWAESYIIKLEEAGIVAKDSKFRPDDSISRAELLAMLFRAAETELSPYADSFGDVNADDWFAAYIQTALDAGIVSEADSFRPNDAITREEAAKIVANLLELASELQADFADNGEISEWAIGFVNAVAEAGIFKGDENGNFNPKGKLTRAEMATVICRLIESGAFGEEVTEEETEEETTEETTEENENSDSAENAESEEKAVEDADVKNVDGEVQQ